MRKIAAALLCAVIAATAVFAVGCGGVDISPLYGKTYTFTGKTADIDWDGQTSAGFVPGEEKKSVGDLLEKYFDRINWDYTASSDEIGVLANLTDADKASADAFKAYMDKSADGIYSALEGWKVVIGEAGDTVKVTVTLNGTTTTYDCRDNSPDGNGTGLMSEQITTDTFQGNASFANAWNGTREYFCMNVPVMSEDMMLSVSVPVSVVLYAGENEPLVTIMLIAETTVS